MYARVRAIQSIPGELATRIQTIQNTDLPALQQAAGFLRLLLLASLSDSASGERLEAVTFWSDAAALTAFDAECRQRQQTLLAADATDARSFDVPLAAGLPGGNVARYIAAELNPGQTENAITLFENVVMHAATAQQGFRRGYLLVDRARDRAISIGLWDSETALLESEQVGYLTQQIGNFGQILAAPIVPETLTVIVET